MNCKDASMLVSQSMDRSLSWRERLALRVHLLACDACTRLRKQLLFLRQLLRRMPTEVGMASSFTLSPPARQRLHAMLQQQRD
jgi:hypothetical protein